MEFPDDLQFMELTDYVLLRVMRHLDVPSVLACRLVCKRLAALALDAELWRDRRLLVGDESPWLRAVLRLAPCLECLEVPFPIGMDPAVVAATRTRCAVAELVLTVDKSAPCGGLCPDCSMLASCVIRNQQKLGRLRKLSVKMDNFSPALVNTIVSTCGLEELHLQFLADCGPGPTNCNAVCRHGTVSPLPALSQKRPASLKAFSFQGTRGCPGYVYNGILATHAATLERVEMFCLDFTAEVAPLLAGMPKLNDLRCVLLRGMQALAAGCPALTDVSLIVMPVPAIAGAIPDAAEFLRRAKQVNVVELTFASDGRSDAGANLLAALQPSVVALSLRSSEGWGERSDLLPQMRVLLAAPVLRTLHVLAVDVPAVADELLLGITPRTAPALERIHLAEDWEHGEGVEPRCDHDWLHKPAVQTFLRANHSVLLTTPDHHCSTVPCDACKQGCEVECSKKWCDCPHHH